MLVARFVTTGKILLNRLSHWRSNLVTIFANHGDRDLNRRILDRLGYREYYNKFKRDFYEGYHYVMLNLSGTVDMCLRVSTNLFSENTKFAEFY